MCDNNNILINNSSSNNFRRKTEYLDACYESWKTILDKFDALLKSVRSLSPNPSDALQRLIDDAKVKLSSKREELERLYDGNIELLRKGIELHDTAPIVIRLEVNWSQIVRTAYTTADCSNKLNNGLNNHQDLTVSTTMTSSIPFAGGACESFGGTAMSTPNSEMAIPFAVDAAMASGRSSSNSPCVFGSIGSGLTATAAATTATINSSILASSGYSSRCSVAGGGGPGGGSNSTEPFLSVFTDQIGGSESASSRITDGGGGINGNNNNNNNNNNHHHNHNHHLHSNGDSATFDSSWLPGWTGVDGPFISAFQQQSQNSHKKVNNGDDASSSMVKHRPASENPAAFESILGGHLFSGGGGIGGISTNVANNNNNNNDNYKSASFSTIANLASDSSSGDKSVCFDWLFNCLKDWRLKKLLSVPFELLLDNCSAHATDQHLMRALGGETVDHLVAFLRQYPSIFSINLNSATVSLVMSATSATDHHRHHQDADAAADLSSSSSSSGSNSAPSSACSSSSSLVSDLPPGGANAYANEVVPSNNNNNNNHHHHHDNSNNSIKKDKGNKDKDSCNCSKSTPPVTMPMATSKQRRSGSLLELDDFGNTSNSSHEGSSSLTSDDGSWQEVVKKVQRNNAGKPNLPSAPDIRERIISVLDLASHGSNLSKLIAVEILRRAVKENAVPKDLTTESIEMLRSYLPNALSSARGKLARPKPNLPPEHADWTYKTKLCVQFATTRQCSMAAQCRFAHGLGELRPKRRAEYCSYWKKSGSCPRRDSCQYAHSVDELGQFVDSSAAATGVAHHRSSLTCSSSIAAFATTTPCASSPTLYLNGASAPAVTGGDLMNMASASASASADCCWLCKGQRRGVPSKNLKCGHKFHSQCLNKFTKKQLQQHDISQTVVERDEKQHADENPICPKCRTVTIATVAVNV